MGNRCALRMMAGVRRPLGGLAGLTLLLCAACGAEDGTAVVPNGKKEGAAGDRQSTTSGSSALPVDGGAVGADGSASGADGGASGSNAGAGGHTPQHELFTDSAVPDCLVPGAPWKIQGSIGSQGIMLGSDVFVSRLMVGELHVIGDGPRDGGAAGDSHYPLILTWDGTVAKGEVKPLTGKRFLIPGDPERPTGYCITAGEIGPSLYATGVLFKFRIRSVRHYAMGECMGAEQPANLAGCMIRTDNSLPR